jgi:hypothetical protein
MKKKTRKVIWLTKEVFSSHTIDRKTIIFLVMAVNSIAIASTGY